MKQIEFDYAAMLQDLMSGCFVPVTDRKMDTEVPIYAPYADWAEALDCDQLIFDECQRQWMEWRGKHFKWFPVTVFVPDVENTYLCCLTPQEEQMYRDFKDEVWLKLYKANPESVNDEDVLQDALRNAFLTAGFKIMVPAGPMGDAVEGEVRLVDLEHPQYDM